MGGRRRDVVLHEVKKLLFGACCALGGLAGLWSGIWSAPLSERRGALGSDLASMAQPLLAHLALGLAAGAALALGLGLTILRPRASR